MVELATPSATTVVGLAATVETDVDTVPAVNVTDAVCVSVIPSVLSVAVIVLAPEVLERIVPVV
jgi:hypothetical protein